MQRPGYNPTRRNRNIGTDKAGYGQNNRLVIPEAWADDRLFYEKLVDPIEIEVPVRSVSVHIIVEPPQTGFVHACTIDDIVHVMRMIPVEHFAPIKVIVLRQPKRKERILSPVWGRLVYWSNIGVHSGPTIYLESQDIARAKKWTTSLDPDGARELERLLDDGHSVRFNRRHHLIASTPDSVRKTQLYRTLPHEIGHYVDYLRSVEEPSRDDYDRHYELSKLYWKKPPQEREAFAHRYADEFRARMTREGRLPFERIVDEAAMRRQGLLPEWFLLPSTTG
jgi:hypothetical protein